MTKAQRKTLEKLRKNRALRKPSGWQGADHWRGSNDRILIENRDGDHLAILPTGLVVPR